MERILEKLIRLPLDVMISSMETMTKTMQEIQHKSESQEEEARSVKKGKRPKSALGNAPQLALTPLFEMYKVPTSGLASGFKTISQAMEEIRHPVTTNGTATEEEQKEVDAEVVPLDGTEAAQERRTTLSEGDIASFGNTLWQIGRPGRSDHAGSFTALFDYHLGKDIDPLGNPRMPHLLAVAGGPKSSGATARLNIHFALEREYEAGELALSYDRWGGEKDLVYVDNKLLTPVSGAGRGRLRRVTLSLRSLAKGAHVIGLTTSGDTTDKEHRVDELKLAEVRLSASTGRDSSELPAEA